MNNICIIKVFSYKYYLKNEVMKWTREVIVAVNMSGEI